MRPSASTVCAAAGWRSNSSVATAAASSSSCRHDVYVHAGQVQGCAAKGILPDGRLPIRLQQGLHGRQLEPIHLVDRFGVHYFLLLFFATEQRTQQAVQRRVVGRVLVHERGFLGMGPAPGGNLVPVALHGHLKEFGFAEFGVNGVAELFAVATVQMVVSCSAHDSGGGDDDRGGSDVKQVAAGVA